MGFQKGEWILLGVGVGIMLLAVLISAIINWFLIFPAFILGALFIIPIFYIGRLFLKQRSEPGPFKFEVRAESKLVGKIRPTTLIFYFRNQDYANLFKKANA